MRLCAWSGPFLVAAWVAALVGGGFIPPDSPSTSAESITAWYEDNSTVLRIASVVLMVTGCLWATWGAVVCVKIRRMEKGRLLTYTTIALVGGGYVFFEMVALFWGVAAFRPGELDPELTLTLHDLGWFSVLFDWPPFALLNVVIAVAVLRDRSVPSVLPRWAGYMSLYCAFIFAPAGAIIFAKTGPVAYSGILALYIPLGVFFLWMCGMTVALLKSIKQDEARLASEEPSEPIPAPRTPEPAGV